MISSRIDADTHVARITCVEPLTREVRNDLAPSVTRMNSNEPCSEQICLRAFLFESDDCNSIPSRRTNLA